MTAPQKNSPTDPKSRVFTVGGTPSKELDLDVLGDMTVNQIRAIAEEAGQTIRITTEVRAELNKLRSENG